MIRDLSLDHKPVSNFLNRTNGEIANYRLDEDQVRCFRESGYLSGVRILDDQQVETLRQELAGLAESSHPDTASSTNITRTSRATRIPFSSTHWERGESHRDFTTYSGVRHSQFQLHSCSMVRCASGTISFSANPPITAEW
jgi:hypothetical protein